MKNRFHFKIGGLAGEGIMVTGAIFSKFAVRSGYNVMDFAEYPSLIRGGHNTFYGTISNEEVFSTYHQIDLLIALNQETVKFHKQELNSGAGIIYDPDEFSQEAIRGIRLFPIPLLRLAEQAGHKLMANTVALGAMVYLTAGKLEILNSVLKDIFADKKEEVIKGNFKAAKLGFDFSQDKFTPLGQLLKMRHSGVKMVIAGNEAIALGAIAAGLKFAAIYPMTPISSILTYLAAHEREAGIVLRQPEDEIAGINMAVGASFAGVRSLVATSGGGFALMSETLSLAGITETPVVVVFGQRAGPATGIPTWTAQEDLLYALTAAQGEYPRIILAPADAEECFHQTAEAFNLAEVYQTPVIVLVDKFVCEAHQSLKEFDLGKVRIDRGKIGKSRTVFPRYQLAIDGISPRAFPAKGVVVKANSDEHDEYGLSDESVKNRKAQVEKRMKKVATLVRKVPALNLYGPRKANLTIVGCGSTKGPILEAISGLSVQNPKLKVNFLHLNWLRPFPADVVSETLKRAEKILLIENNYQGQLGQWLRMQTGIEIKDRLLKYDGRQFYPEEITTKIKQII
ncbi:MAG TPA: 2-oxoacid:acceptor oxidoreductase subunit alpha [Candidatus Bathyarchaeia archaeon]|nr:2-oxoacid:acceptor oxidoreductase subunit alpha [Candidatus Bathyarchaeia archaeon]